MFVLRLHAHCPKSPNPRSHLNKASPVSKDKDPDYCIMTAVGALMWVGLPDSRDFDLLSRQTLKPYPKPNLCSLKPHPQSLQSLNPNYALRTPPIYYSSFYFLFHYPYITPILYTMVVPIFYSKLSPQARNTNHYKP